MAINAGEFRHRLEVWKLTEERDEFGAITNSKVLVGSYWCKAIHESNKEVGDQLKRSQQGVIFIIRFNTELEQPTNDMYIRFKGEEWDIVSVINPIMLNEKLVITCVDRGTS